MKNFKFTQENFYQAIKCLMWFIFTLIFAFSQDWIAFLINWGSVDKQPIFDEFIRDGALFFFSIVLVSSLTVDYFLFRRCKLSENFDTVTNTVFFSISFIIILTCASLFYNFHETPLDKIDISALAIMELTLVSITAIYSIFIKFLSLLECKK